ncbi:MAG TPA: MFS transporter [Oligoflexus sp.]|uniref:MFS transporter n=1 Tax=Oligoflexus sp. TaxID=1971216 RepID=UPI002D80CB6F|nr:MFS transporter [Oligoflexus sp.]HET9238110.1 MFS transporter [Oligoflexus sp.]
MNAKAQAPATRSAGQMILDYFREFKVLKETPREYWGIQIINFLDCTAYFALLNIVTIFLSDQIGLDDNNAGYIVTLFTSLTTILLLIAGFATDSLGIRKSLWLAMLTRAAATAAVVFLAVNPNVPHRALLVAACFVAMAPSMAMVQTVFQSANKRYTSERSRSAGFNLWYLFMNIGAAAAGVVVDVVRLSLGLSSTWVIGTGIVTSFLCLGVMLIMVRREEQFGEEGRFVAAPVQETKRDANGKKPNPFTILKAMVSESAFWRFCVLVTLLLGVRAVFSYMYLLMPKYWTRVMGEDAAIGTLNTINPILIVVGLIVFIPFANKFNIFKMLVFGAMISAVSLFALVIPWQVVGQGLGAVGSALSISWMRNDFVPAYYAMSALSMVFLSIGEVIWSPKLQEYTAAIAPEGQEGSYFGLSMVPWFAAKTIVSALSGHMLSRWVPEGIGERLRAGTVPFWDSPEAMWLILGLVALAGPILALAFQGWLTKGARWHKATGSGH